MALGKIVAENVKAIRLERGIPQAALAQKSKLTVRYISRLENTAPNVTLDVLERLAKGLGCSVTELLGAEGESEKQIPIKALIAKNPLNFCVLRMIWNCPE